LNFVSRSEENRPKPTANLEERIGLERCPSCTAYTCSASELINTNMEGLDEYESASIRVKFPSSGEFVHPTHAGESPGSCLVSACVL
jgi:hypothetical protein